MMKMFSSKSMVTILVMAALIYYAMAQCTQRGSDCPIPNETNIQDSCCNGSHCKGDSPTAQKGKCVINQPGK